MTTRLALVRATHLNDYIKVLRDLGAPVDRDLARSQLPGRIEETPELFVSIPVAMEWVARTGRDLEPMELGLLGARAATLSSLRAPQQAAILTARTGLMRLEALVAASRFEDSALTMSLRREGEDLRVFCAMAGLGRHPNLCLAEWLNLQAVISAVRSVVGPSWRPSELCFASSSRLPDAVRQAFPDTRILVGQPLGSILVARADLARLTDDAFASAQDPGAAAALEQEPEHASAVWEFASLMRLLVQPYLNEGRLDVAFAAEMAGISTRTLQRRLTMCGSSYSQILQEARFTLACRRLEDRDLKVIDVAMMAGYESPQHFTRAFRRFTGFTPSEYRHQRAAGE